MEWLSNEHEWKKSMFGFSQGGFKTNLHFIIRALF